MSFVREFRARGVRAVAAISGKMLQKKKIEKVQTFVTDLQKSGRVVF